LAPFALRDVQLTAYGGQVHVLMGENGAGKSTLMKVLAGANLSDPGGEIRIDGKPAAIVDPSSAKSAGVAIIYQELALAPNLSVLEKHLPRTGGAARSSDRPTPHDERSEILARLGASFGPSTLVADLSIAERQLVEIARAIDAKSRILVMDEPTTALSDRETRRLFELIARLKDGKAVGRGDREARRRAAHGTFRRCQCGHLLARRQDRPPPSRTGRTGVASSLLGSHDRFVRFRPTTP
jgi:ribose transport system ATP-binding protein